MCVCCYREQITNRSGLAGLKSATRLDLSNYTACESLMWGERASEKRDCRGSRRPANCINMQYQTAMDIHVSCILTLSIYMQY